MGLSFREAKGDHRASGLTTWKESGAVSWVGAAARQAGVGKIMNSTSDMLSLQAAGYSVWNSEDILHQSFLYISYILRCFDIMGDWLARERPSVPGPANS